jgi:hypothetical protein
VGVINGITFDISECHFEISVLKNKKKKIKKKREKERKKVTFAGVYRR